MDGSALPQSYPPVPLTSLVGREREVDELQRLLERTRLLTLTGAGGSGKTRLALEVFLRGREGDPPPGPPERVWVELASLANPDLLPQQVVAALGIREEVRPGDPAAVLPFLPAQGPILLVLDNCEHLVEACAALAETLLRARPGLRILATSREALGVSGERAWLVPPLTTPEPGDPPEAMVRTEALRLFLDRARDVSRSFELTPASLPVAAEICRALEGIPLGIELAAARVRVLSLEQIRDRLNDALSLLTDGGRRLVPRHRTLRTAIEWSHDLLPQEARVLLRRLSVFRGGFDLDAAAAVALDGPGADPLEVLDGVALLVDRSLLRVQEMEGTARYTLLETVRQYAALHLEAAGEGEQIRSRHARHLAREAAVAVPFVVGGDRLGRISRLGAEMENLREALRWSRRNEPCLHLSMVADLWWFWFFTRHWKEAESTLREALALPEAREPGVVRARLLLAAGALNILQARTGEGRPLVEEALRLAHEAGEAHVAATSENYLALSWVQVGDLRGAPHAARALSWFRETDHHSGHRMALLMSALVCHFQGDVLGADTHSLEALEVARRCGPADLAIALQNWSLIWALRGDYARAEPLVRASLVALREDRSWLFIARGLAFLGEAAGVGGHPLEAARLLGAAHGLREAIGNQPFAADAARLARVEPGFRAAVGDALWEEAFRAGAETPLDEMLESLLREEDGTDPLDAVERAVAALGRLGPVPASGSTSTSRSPLEALAPAASPRGEPDPVAPASPREPAAAEPGAAPALRILSLGPLQLEGESVESGPWAYARPRELLLFLLLHPRGVTRQEIGEAIWPEATPPQVKNSFHVTLHHLRRKLGGAHWIVLEQDRYRLARERGVEWDAERFEEGVRAALRADPAPEPGLLRAVLAPYRGPLLDGAGGARWVEDARDRYRMLYVDGLALLARTLEDRGDLAGALDEWTRTVEVDEMNEEAHRGLMRVWARSGARDRALRHFERLRVLLREALETEPEEETVRLHLALRAGKR